MSRYRETMAEALKKVYEDGHEDVSSSKRIAHIIEHDNDQDTNLSELISLQKNKDIIFITFKV